MLWGALGPEAGAAVGLCAFLGAAFTAAAAALGAAELLTVSAVPLRGGARRERGRDRGGVGAGIGRRLE